MSLLWIDGFEGYGTSVGSTPSPTGVMGRKYNMVSENGIDIEVGRLAGYCMELASSSCEVFTPSLTTDATLIIGFAFKIISGGANNIVVMRTGSTVGMGVRWLDTGELSVRLGTSTIATTSTLALTSNTWYWLEFKVVCNNSTGSYSLKVGGTEVLSGSSIDTQAGASAYHDNVYFSSSLALSVDDFYICDGAGSVNNDFLGNCRVLAIRPDGAGNSTVWTPDSGDNYTRVNGVIIDDDTSYVESDTTDDLDLYTYADVADLGDIFGIQINTCCKETDATSFSLKTTIRSGTTNYDDSAQSIGTTNYITKKRIAEVDPDTTTAWTISGLNAAEFGIKVG